MALKILKKCGYLRTRGHRHYENAREENPEPSLCSSHLKSIKKIEELL